MLKNLELKYSGVLISVHPMKPLKAVRITKVILQLLGKGMSGDSSKTHILAAIATGLTSMDDKAFDEFVTYVYSGSQVIKQKEQPFTIEDEESFDTAFEGIDLENIFLGIFEILKFNRFPFLREVDVNIGELMTEIGLSVKGELSPEKPAKDTENQESSQKKSE